MLIYSKIKTKILILFIFLEYLTFYQMFQGNLLYKYTII